MSVRSVFFRRGDSARVAPLFFRPSVGRMTLATTVRLFGVTTFLMLPLAARAAETAPAAPAAVDAAVPVAPAGAAAPDAEVSELAAREKASPGLQEFQGGDDTIVIGASTLAVVLLVVIVILLLR